MLGLPAPRLSPPGRPGQQAQVSHTAGSSASCRRAREGHSPEATGSSGPAFSDSGQVGWPSGGRRAQPDLMPSLHPLRGEASQVCPQKYPLRSLPTTSVPTLPPRATMPAHMSCHFPPSPTSPWGARVMTLFLSDSGRKDSHCMGGVNPHTPQTVLRNPYLPWV